MIYELNVQTNAQECMILIQDQVAHIIQQSGITAGTAVLYIPHTTCALTIQENADPGVQHDMLMVLRRMVPRRDVGYRHIEENSAAHLQASLLGFSHTIFINDGTLLLGRWQSIYLAEFDGPRTRQVLIKILPD